MSKKHTQTSENDRRSESFSKEAKIPTEDEIMSRPGTRDVLRVFHGWKKKESEEQKIRSVVSE